LRKTFRRRQPAEVKQLKYPINEAIQAASFVVIDEDGKNLGVLEREQALSIAHERGLDVILVSPGANPPVSKLIDQGKFRYEQEKQLRKQKAHQKKIEIKGVRLTFKMGVHDKELRKMQAARFMEKGHKVKIEMMLRGRERQFGEMAIENIKKFINSFGQNIALEQQVSIQGNRLSAIIYKKNS